MCAIAAGCSVATTMSFTAIDGLPMGTRSGALDPGIILYLLEHEKMDVLRTLLLCSSLAEATVLTGGGKFLYASLVNCRQEIHGHRKIVMQIPLQVTFEGTDPSEAVRVAIGREVERLEKHNRHIIGCRVAIIAPSHKHHHGTGFHVHISLTVPRHETVIVNHAPSDDKRYEHIEVAIKDAFAAARRQLDDLAQQS
jgi:ribosome-associated translation inhibitor RaiA